jgi:hypothetical protein
MLEAGVLHERRSIDMRSSIARLPSTIVPILIAAAAQGD